MEPITSLLTAWHMGPLHAYERWLTLILAFGPFLLLALVFVIRRRMDDAEDDDESQGDGRDRGVGTTDGTPERPSGDGSAEDALASGQAGSVRQPGESDAMLDLERRAE